MRHHRTPPNVWWATAILAVDKFFCFGLASSKGRVRGTLGPKSQRSVRGAHDDSCFGSPRADRLECE